MDCQSKSKPDPRGAQVRFYYAWNKDEYKPLLALMKLHTMRYSSQRQPLFTFHLLADDLIEVIYAVAADFVTGVFDHAV